MRIRLIQLLSYFAWAVANAGGQDILPTVTLDIEGHQVIAELAVTTEQHRLGLSGRDELAPGTGMLFDFADAEPVCMWMADTSVPLTAAFIELDGTIIAVESMKPFDRALHCAPIPVRFVLEIPLGWLAEKNIGIGSKIANGPFKNVK